jgi:hypothetical protein
MHPPDLCKTAPSGRPLTSSFVGSSLASDIEAFLLLWKMYLSTGEVLRYESIDPNTIQRCVSLALLEQTAKASGSTSLDLEATQTSSEIPYRREADYVECSKAPMAIIDNNVKDMMMRMMPQRIVTINQAVGYCYLGVDFSVRVKY